MLTLYELPFPTARALDRQPGRRVVMSEVIVHQAESGASLRLSLPPDASVGALALALEPATCVPAAQQILLLDGLKLEDERALAEYGLPHAADPRERPVFLFSRQLISRSAPVPERRPIPPLELVEPVGRDEHVDDAARRHVDAELGRGERRRDAPQLGRADEPRGDRLGDAEDARELLGEGEVRTADRDGGASHSSRVALEPAAPLPNR